MKDYMDRHIKKPRFELDGYFKWHLTQKLEVLLIKNYDLCFLFCFTRELLTCILFPNTLSRKQNKFCKATPRNLFAFYNFCHNYKLSKILSQIPPNNISFQLPFHSVCLNLCSRTSLTCNGHFLNAGAWAVPSFLLAFFYWTLFLQLH